MVAARNSQLGVSFVEYCTPYIHVLMGTCVVNSRLPPVFMREPDTDSRPDIDKDHQMDPSPLEPLQNL